MTHPVPAPALQIICFCKLLGTSVIMSSGLHLQSNGINECITHEMEKALRVLVSQNPSSWSRQVLWVEYDHDQLSPRPLTIPVCLWALATPVPSLGERDLMPIRPDIQSPLSLDLKSGLCLSCLCHKLQLHLCQLSSI